MVLAVHVLMLVLVLMVVHAMKQAAMAMVRKLLSKGGLIQGTARAQSELCIVRAKVQVG